MISRPNKNRSRLVLAISAGFIFTGEILAGFVIDRAPLEIRFPEAAQVIDALALHRGTKPILFFGTSRFMFDIHPESIHQEIERANTNNNHAVLNAAVTAGDPIAIDFLSGRLLASGIVPSIAVIEVLPESVSQRNPWLQFHLIRQFRWGDVWSSIPDAFRAGRLGELISSRLIPLSLFRREFQEWALKAIRFDLALPHAGNDTIPSSAPAPTVRSPQSDLLELRSTTARKRLRSFKIGGRAAQALETVLRRYRDLGTTVLLVAPPLPADYRKEQAIDVETKFRAYMQRLSATYGAQFVDYRERLPDGFFQGRYYMTQDGKYHFSKLFAKETLVPLIKGRGKVLQNNLSTQPEPLPDSR